MSDLVPVPLWALALMAVATCAFVVVLILFLLWLVFGRDRPEEWY